MMANKPAYSGSDDRMAPKLPVSPEPAIARIDAQALRGNLETIRRQTGPDVALCVAVKANAYGHGLETVLPILGHAGVESVAVAYLAEALAVRALGWTRPILSFGPVLSTDDPHDRAGRARQAVAADVSCSVTSLDEVRQLAHAAADLHRKARVEFQIDSGIGRSGPLYAETDAIIDMIARGADCANVAIDGVYTHFAGSDEADLSFTHEQLDRFIHIVGAIDDRQIPVASFHAANSTAIFRLPESHFSRVRPGLSVYGYWGGPDGERPDDLTPTLRLVSPFTEVRRFPPGQTIGYGSTFTTQRDSLIGTIPIGYADGYRRALSNNAVVGLLNADGSTRCSVPVVGRVSMDMINVDLTDAGDVSVGDAAVLIDNHPASNNSVEALAQQLDTIPYEITTLLGQRIHRTAAE